MSDEEFYQVYGRMPRKNKNKKKKVKVYWGRISIAAVVLIIVIVGIVKIVGAVSGKSKKGKDAKTAVTSSADKRGDDYYAAPENKENDVVYNGIELTVCIDPAHGGIDKGTVGEDGRLEKTDTLEIAKALKEYLEGCGVKVIMTRSDDSYVSVEDRCKTANDNNADLFISIHRSSTEIAGSDTHGFEAWIHTSKPEADRLFGQKIMTKLQDTGISENRGVRAGYPDDSSVNYPINQLTVMPSVLLDMGYLTSSIDNQLLEANLEAYARAIGNAIISAANELGVTDDNGARLLNGQLLSNKPAPEAKPEETESKPDESSVPDESSQAEEADDTQDVYGYDEGYSYDDTQTESEPDIVYTDDGMGYYTDPMTTE
jgi:N-acetylmuramoyl-L-alanine amidase